MTSTTVLGLVGLGNMGAAIAHRLARGGRLLGVDLDPARRDAAAEDGVEVSDDLASLAAADVVVLSLPSPAASIAVAERLVDILRPGTLVVETSTVNPADMQRLAGILAAKRIRSLDVAILSGVAGMRAGTSMLLAGGDPADLDEVRPVLELMSSEIRHFGPIGSGMAAKVINNAVAHAVMVVLVEAAALGATSGLEVDRLLDLLQDPEAGLLRPLTHRMRERVARGDYSGGMPTDAARKDSTLALELAQTNGVPLFAVQGAHTAYELAVAAGLGRDDYAALATLWEGWTGRRLGEAGGTE